ncbi:uncharacterized protein TNCV_610151 [Trichonephila clavipes]|nr:uncharacterized protein TNCV_610151 [Trichonephila clavipes]
MGIKDSTRNGRHNPKCLSVMRLHMVRGDTSVPNEGATCTWMMADEAFDCMRAFLTMWLFSRRLVCEGRPEPELHVNDISLIQWSPYLLMTQSERSY